jgi:hypothetical protein
MQQQKGAVLPKGRRVLWATKKENLDVEFTLYELNFLG